jgi:hypothetical protein
MVDGSADVLFGRLTTEDIIPPEALLAAYPESMRRLAERLRSIVIRAAPDSVERVRPGWRLIGYDLRIGRRMTFFAYVAAETHHVHLGFPYGVFMNDPDRVLLGGGVTRRARWVTLPTSGAINPPVLERLVHEARRVAHLSRGERIARLASRD